MRSKALWLVALAFLVTACWKDKLLPGRCDRTSDCPAGQTCNLDPTPQGDGRCVPSSSVDGGDGPIGDGPADRPDGSDARTDTAPCSATSCIGAAPICDPTAKSCRACGGASECVTRNPMTPVCAASGQCVECSASQDCTASATTPICATATNVCRACSASAECAARDTTTPACDGSGACVECVTSSDCKSAAAPICDTAKHACMKCTADAECAARDTTTPACSPTGGCVACTDGKKDCPAGAPICDANACRACKKDAECAAGYGADPGVCVGGKCATNDQVVYVQNGDSCAQNNRGDGSLSKPLCYPSDVPGALSSLKTIVIVRGPKGVTETLPLGAPSAPIVVAGQAGANFGTVAGNSALVSMTGGDVTIRDLNISGGSGSGVSATGGTLRMTRCYVTGNKKSGIEVDNAAFDITNTVVAMNMGASAVSLGTYTGAGPTRFAFNTVVNNVGLGVFCAQTYGVSGLLLNSNQAGNSSPMCTTDATTSTAPPMFGARPYHLTATSPCVNAAGTTNLPPDDIDGDVRPQGPAADCGADEYVP